MDATVDTGCWAGQGLGGRVPPSRGGRSDLPTGGRTAPATILVVDDDAVYARALSRVLVDEGYRVVVAENHARALTLLQSAPRPTMALVDLRLGEDSGLDTIEALKAATPHLRVVLVSSYTSVSTTVAAMRLGAHDCLPKTASVPELLSALTAASTSEDAGEIATLDRAAWEHIQRALAVCGGNLTHAARKLGIPRRSLQRKLRRPPPH